MTKRKDSASKAIRDIRRATRRQYSAEEKIRIVLEGLRGESSIAELCRKEGINQNLYYRWSKEFLEAGKKRLAGDTAREANSDEVKGLRSEAAQLGNYRSKRQRAVGCCLGRFDLLLRRRRFLLCGSILLLRGGIGNVVGSYKDTATIVANVYLNWQLQ